LVYGLKAAQSLSIRRLIVQGDSLLIVKQMKSVYETKEETLAVLREEAIATVKSFDHFDIAHIPRAQNSRADWLACHAMNKEDSYGFDFLDGS